MKGPPLLKLRDDVQQPTLDELLVLIEGDRPVLACPRSATAEAHTVYIPPCTQDVILIVY